MAAAGSNRVYIGNLPEGFTEDALRAAFEGVGAISEVEKASGLRRFGWVTFESEADAAKAIAEMDGKSVAEGTEGVKVEAARPKVERAPRPAVEEVMVPGNPRRVKVTGLAEDTSEDAVRAVLADCGAIEKAKIVARRADNVHAFVTFEDVSGAEAAVAKTGSSIGGEAITVVPEPPSRRRTRKRGGARGGGSGGEGTEAAPRAPRPKKQNKSLRVTGFPEGTSPAAVAELFSGVGTVESSEARDDGAVVITFTEADGATAGRQLEDLSLGGEAVKVGFFLPQNRRRRRGPRAAASE